MSIAWLATRASIEKMDLSDLLGSAQVVLGAPFAPMLALKALTSFEDGDLPTLPTGILRQLAAAAAVHRIPVVGAYRSSVSPLAEVGS